MHVQKAFACACSRPTAPTSVTSSLLHAPLHGVVMKALHAIGASSKQAHTSPNTYSTLTRLSRWHSSQAAVHSGSSISTNSHDMLSSLMLKASEPFETDLRPASTHNKAAQTARNFADVSQNEKVHLRRQTHWVWPTPDQCDCPHSWLEAEESWVGFNCDWDRDQLQLRCAYMSLWSHHLQLQCCSMRLREDCVPLACLFITHTRTC